MLQTKIQLPIPKSFISTQLKYHAQPFLTPSSKNELKLTKTKNKNSKKMNIRFFKKSTRRRKYQPHHLQTQTPQYATSKPSQIQHQKKKQNKTHTHTHTQTHITKGTSPKKPTTTMKIKTQKNYNSLKPTQLRGEEMMQMARPVQKNRWRRLRGGGDPERERERNGVRWWAFLKLGHTPFHGLRVSPDPGCCGNRDIIRWIRRRPGPATQTWTAIGCWTHGVPGTSCRRSTWANFLRIASRVAPCSLGQWGRVFCVERGLFCGLGQSHPHLVAIALCLDCLYCVLL